MASSQMFLNSIYTINQNGNVNDAFLNEGGYDYTFVINVSGFASNISTMFTNASYMQDVNDMNNYLTNIVLANHSTFNNWNNVFNNCNIVTILQGNSNINFATLQDTYSQKIGDRLLEVVAHKLFGHGQARVAIKNDTEFYSYDSEIWDHLSSIFTNNSLRNDVFNQYVASGRYQSETTNDTNGWVNFNFNGFTFDYPFYLIGNMLTDTSLTNAERNLIQNGPNVGGTSLVNGLYNIPILVRFTQ